VDLLSLKDAVYPASGRQHRDMQIVDSKQAARRCYHRQQQGRTIRSCSLLYRITAAVDNDGKRQTERAKRKALRVGACSNWLVCRSGRRSVLLMRGLHVAKPHPQLLACLPVLVPPDLSHVKLSTSVMRVAVQRIVPCLGNCPTAMCWGRVQGLAMCNGGVGSGT
jgi:hypothetical protein